MSDSWQPPPGPTVGRSDDRPGWGPPPPPTVPPPPGAPPRWAAPLPPGPPAGWGAAPPAAGPQGAGLSGGRPASGQTFSVGDAIGHGWAKTRANLGLVVLVTIAAVIIGAIAERSATALVTATIGAPDDVIVGFGRSAAAGAVKEVITTTVSVLLQAGITAGALALVDGRPVTIDVALPTRYLPRLLIGALLISVAAAIGTLLFIVPGIVVLVLSHYFVYFTIDDDLPVVEALKASASFVAGNFGPLLRLFLVSGLVMLAGALAMVVGLVVAVPVVVLADAYAFRVLQGQPVST